MRLINADLIEKQFDPNTWQGEMMIAIARGLPTAYDVDKVVDTINKTSFYDGVTCQHVVDLIDTIDIIKRGGKDE